MPYRCKGSQYVYAESTRCNVELKGTFPVQQKRRVSAFEACIQT